MTHTLVIAEIGSSWDCDIQKAFRLIDAAKACGADVAKFQWTSNAKAMAERRLGPNAAGPTQMYKRYLEYPLETLTRLKAHCDSVSIEFMCTVYLIEDIATIAPMVKRFKISAFESGWDEFVHAHIPFGKQIIMSVRAEDFYKIRRPESVESIWLHVVSEYPCPIERLKIPPRVGGLSDHTTSLRTGGFAVMRCAEVIEKHIKLGSGYKVDGDEYGQWVEVDDTHGTPKDNPDYPHSLVPSDFKEYVATIREAEKAL